MSVHLIDSKVFGGSLGTPEMKAIFEEKSQFQCWLDTEAALSRAMGELGMIPQTAADRIVAAADVEKIDLDAVLEHGKVTGHSLMGLLTEFRKAVNHKDAGYVHWGATTQDIIDTGQMLMAKQGYELVVSMLRKLMSVMVPLLREHKDTVMVGRTHGGHALPITFGFKAAIWLDELSRQLERLENCRERIFVGNITGAVGTFASWGEKGRDMQTRAMEILGLGVANTCWHSSRDRLAELMNLYGLLGGTCARIGKEIYNLSKTEVMELEEPFKKGQVGSSTMPHKRNPIHTEWVVVTSRILRSNAALAMEVMMLENERDATNWKTEWLIIPESHVLLSAALQHLTATMDGLVVKKEHMKKNTNMLHGLLLSEPAMFVLTDFMPLPDAHHTVYEASMRAFNKETELYDELLADPVVAESVDKEKLKKAMDPEGYTGLAPDVALHVADKVEEQLAKATK